jgi:sulfopropanediol 3-dehydrogenase
LSITYLKKASMTAATGEADVRATVQTILDQIEQGGDAVARDYARKFDKWDGDIVVPPDRIAAAAAEVPQRLRDDIRFAHDNVRRFAEAQKAAMRDTEIEIIPGLTAGHRHVPVNAAGAYVPGGRYSHIASAIMTVTTASVAGVSHIATCSPPRPGIGVPPAILYTMGLCGAHRVLSLGGVQGVAAMAFGLFGCPKANILVGPGNQFVAEAKRILFGRVGIDMFAGPTESMVIADATADPRHRRLGPDRPGRARLQLAGLADLARPGAGRAGRRPDPRHHRHPARAEPLLGPRRLGRLWRDHPRRFPRGSGAALR